MLAADREKSAVRRFIETFRPLQRLLKEAKDDELTAERCFHLQLTGGGFATVVLRYVTRCCRKSYFQAIGLAKRLVNSLSIFISAHHLARYSSSSEKGENSVGDLPLPASSYYQRFGGLLAD